MRSGQGQGQGEQRLDGQTDVDADADESPKKKWCRLAMKSGFGEAALEGRGACVEPRRGVAITRPQRGSGQLWWGVALPLLAQYLRRQRRIGRLR
jgi:hypothetical protein